MSGGKSASQPVLRSRFDVAVQALLATEGGLVDNPADPGGLTRYGWTLRTLVADGKLGAARALCDIDHNGLINGQDIRALTLDLAAALYKRFFWDALGLVQLPPPVDAMMLDQCVNLGAITAFKLLQAAVGGLKLDGDWGPKSDAAFDAAVAAHGVAALVLAYKAAARAHYHALILANPKLKIFEKGWNARVDRLGDV